VAKTVLGRGLDALLGDTGATSFPSRPAALPPGVEQDENGSLLVALDLLRPNPHQPRTEFDEAALRELADSIRENGVIQPITAENASDGFFYIVAGERRARAARLAGLAKIPVQLKTYADDHKLEIALIENIQREDLNPVEEARAYCKLMEISSLSQEEVARRVGKNRSTVANAVRLLKLPEDMLAALAAGTMTAGHARALLAVQNVVSRRTLFARIAGGGLSVRDAEQYASGAESPTAKPAKKDAAEMRDPDFAQIEQELIERLGTRVALKGTFDKGSIQVDFYSRTDFERLYALIAPHKT
jgi:ParB family chromosome partitioning protein